MLNKSNQMLHSCIVLQVSALLIGFSYTQVRLNQAGIQDIEGVLFFFVTENAFPALYGVLNLFPEEMPLFFREYNNGIYRSDTYYISKIISQVCGGLARTNLSQEHVCLSLSLTHRKRFMKDMM